MKIYTGSVFDHFSGRTKPEVAAVAHVCNCQGVMGSGIAKEVRARYPEAYQAYKKFETDSFDGLQLGTMSFGRIRPDKIIYNLHAQMFYGTDGRRYLDYEGLCCSLEKACNDLCFRGLNSLAVPYNMGWDRAGGNWTVVSAMLQAVFEPHNISVIAIKL